MPRPNGLTTRNSRYSFGGHTEVSGDALGHWEPASTDALKSYSEQRWTVTGQYVGRPDLIAHRFYGTVSLAWLILQHNGIIDDLEQLVEGVEILIPDPERVTSGLAALKASDTTRAI